LQFSLTNKVERFKTGRGYIQCWSGTYKRYDVTLQPSTSCQLLTLKLMTTTSHSGSTLSYLGAPLRPPTDKDALGNGTSKGFLCSWLITAGVTRPPIVIAPWKSRPMDGPDRPPADTASRPAVRQQSSQFSVGLVAGSRARDPVSGINQLSVQSAACIHGATGCRYLLRAPRQSRQLLLLQCCCCSCSAGNWHSLLSRARFRFIVCSGAA